MRDHFGTLALPFVKILCRKLLVSEKVFFRNLEPKRCKSVSLSAKRIPRILVEKLRFP